jgi:CYTH domain-containing protein
VPVENERKYVLKSDFDAGCLTGWTRHDIRQAYLNDGPRIRQRDEDYIFTYKKWVPHAGELVEIETAISEDDFNLLWPLCIQRIAKTRYVLMTDEVEWVVDFLRDDNGQVYFVLAEAELPRGQAAPGHIPVEIAGGILHSVDAADNRFTNKKLSNQAYAAGLYDLVT